MHHFKSLMIAAAMAVAAIPAAWAANYEIKTLDVSTDGTQYMVFEPSYLEIQPGDTVTFTPGGNYHNAASIAGMLPDGAEAFAGEIDQPITVTFDVPGVYGIECTPHFVMGMVALIVVGEPTNLEAAKAAEVPEEAAARFETLFAQIGAK